MRSDWLTLQRWGAIFAVALFVLSTTPHDHDHDGAECVDSSCMPCHVQGLPLINAIDHSGDTEAPDASVGRISCADTPDHPRNAEIHGKDCRAPPG